MANPIKNNLGWLLASFWPLRKPLVWAGRFLKLGWNWEGVGRN